MSRYSAALRRMHPDDLSWAEHFEVRRGERCSECMLPTVMLPGMDDDDLCCACEVDDDQER